MSLHELFTDSARRLMQLAGQEAQRFEHEYIGTEHLLLALVLVEDGTSILNKLKVDPRKIRLNVEKLVQPGPEPVTIDNPPGTPRAKSVIKYAMAESRLLGHKYVGAEHILLGLLREEEGVAAQILMNLGLKLEDVLEEIRYPSSGPRATAKRAEKFADHPLVRAYRAAIEALTAVKEECIEHQEFEKAATKRDDADQIKRELSQLIRRLEADELLGPAAGMS